MKTSKILWDFQHIHWPCYSPPLPRHFTNWQRAYQGKNHRCSCAPILRASTGREVDHYKDLDIELSRLWQKQVIIIPIIVGSLGCVKSNLHKALKDLSIEAECHSYTLQKTAVSPQNISCKEFLISTGSAAPSGFPYPVLQTCTRTCTVKLERNNNNSNNNNWELWWWFRSAKGSLSAPFKTDNKGLLGSRWR